MCGFIGRQRELLAGTRGVWHEDTHGHGQV
jgi:hypothetical protein